MIDLFGLDIGISILEKHRQNMTKSTEGSANQPSQKIVINDIKIDRDECPIGMASFQIQVRNESGGTMTYSMTIKMGEDIVSVAHGLMGMASWLNGMAVSDAK